MRGGSSPAKTNVERLHFPHPQQMRALEHSSTPFITGQRGGFQIPPRSPDVGVVTIRHLSSGDLQVGLTPFKRALVSVVVSIAKITSPLLNRFNVVLANCKCDTRPKEWFSLVGWNTTEQADLFNWINRNIEFD